MYEKPQFTEEFWDNLKLSNDFLFGYVMQDTRLARIFLESLLDIEIESVSHVKVQDVIEIAPQFRGVRMDVRLKSDGRIVNVEMQTANHEDLPHRIRFYQAMGDSQLLLRSASYDELPEFLTIFICTFDPFKGGGLPVYTIRQIVTENPDISYDDGRRIILFNTTAWEKSLVQNQRDMLKYIQHGGTKFESACICDFARNITDVKTENIFRRNYMTLSLKLMEMKWDAIREGRAEGHAEGLSEGIRKTAINLIQMKLPAPKISQATGLSVKEIKKLAEEIDKA